MTVRERIQEMIRDEYARRREKAEGDANQRREEIHRVLPQVAVIDEELAGIGPQLMEIVLKYAGDPERLSTARKRNLALQEERKNILTTAGYPGDYTDIRYQCPKCHDTGYVDYVMCSCLREELTKERYHISGLERLLPSQSFDNFSFDYYKDSPRALQLAKATYEVLKKYAETFNPGNHPENILLRGSTGIGKTHLTTSVAGVVMNKGYDVVYVSAPSMIANYEREHFHRYNTPMAMEDDEESTVHYHTADLLIIDDLGTEVINQFSASTLYQLMEDRSNHDLPTIISTNFTATQLQQNYWDRIASRLLGNYRTLLMEGTDIRMQKKKSTIQ